MIHRLRPAMLLNFTVNQWIAKPLSDRSTIVIIGYWPRNDLHLLNLMALLLVSEQSKCGGEHGRHGAGRSWVSNYRTSDDLMNPESKG